MGPRLALGALLLVSCSSVDSVGTLVHEDGPRERSPLTSVGGLPTLLVATQSSDLVVVDPVSGAVVSRAPVASPGGPLDVSVGRSVSGGTWIGARTTTDEDGGGELLLFDFDVETGLGGPRRLGSIQGATAIFTLSFGVVVMQDDLGERWRLLPASGGFTPSMPCGLARSARPISIEPSRVRVEALSFWPEDTLSLLDVVIDEVGVTRCDPKPVEGYGAPSDSVRLVELGVGYERALVDVVDGDLVISALDATEVAASAAIAGFASRLVAVEKSSVSNGVATFVVVGADPSRVGIVDIRFYEDGAIGASLREAHELDAAAFPESRALGGSLALSNGAIFVATEAGIRTLAHGGAPPFDDDLLGPIAAVTLR